MKGIKQAVALCNGQSSLARACGVSQTAVLKWLCGGKMDVKYIPAIIQATEYEVNPIELRPDLDWSIIYESLKQVFEWN
nr:MAG TPA: Putative antitoxin of bacterial toxin-antitoxin system, YdaS/YdaT [Caudoviricetes sp.]